VADLLREPADRDVSDVKHVVAAAASSTSAERAAQFLKELKCPPEAKAYGSYEELVKDKDVDIIYVATPHSHHYQNAMLCLESGKHVLCEKAFTVNAAQTKRLIETARKNKLFLMEAVWTRYFPLSIQVRKLITDGEIGAVHRAIADLSVGENVEEEWGTEHRMVNKDLAGGAMLDLGIYALTWIFQALYHTVPAKDQQPPQVSSFISKYHKTGVDETTTILLNFPSGPSGATYAHGVAMTSLRMSSDPDGHNSAGPAMRIQGTKGEIQIDHPAYRPTVYRVIKKARKGEKSGPQVQEFKVEPPAGGSGWFWEADEAARCVRDGKLESEGLPLAESLVIMEVMDEVRKQGGLQYSDKLETLDYPVELGRS